MQEIVTLFHLSLIGCVEEVQLPNNITLDIAVSVHKNQLHTILQKWITYHTHNDDIEPIITDVDKSTGQYTLELTHKIGRIPHWNLCALFNVLIKTYPTHIRLVFQFLESIARDTHKQLNEQHYPHALLNGYGATEHTIIKTIKTIVNDLEKYIHRSISE